MRTAASAVLAVVALLCGIPVPAHAETIAADYLGQTLDWHPCGAHECARLRVPMSYDDPSLGDITLAVERVAHTGSTRQGSLVVNPGGPGGAATEFIGYAAGSIAPQVAKAFDFIGMDPRGVGGSTPITCISGRQTTRWLDTDPAPSTQAEIDSIMRQAKAIGPGCLRHDPVLARHIGTDASARDLEVLRSALGDERLNYLGFSYGTVLGAEYAERFPDRVGRFVLDGAVDPSLDTMQVSAVQSVGFQDAMTRFARECAAGHTCGLGSSQRTVLANINRLIARLDSRPMHTDSGRPLLKAQAISAIFTAMYDHSMWPSLASDLRAALGGDGSGLQRLADMGNQRIGPNEYEGNAPSAFYAIDCWDFPPAPGAAGLKAAARAWAKGAAVPSLAEAMSWSNAPCATWFGHSSQAPRPATSTTSAPIVVVGTTHDPATPYAWARALATQLPTGRLLTYVGDGHTAYGADSPCLQQALDDYLLTGTPPPAGTRCR